MMTIKEGAEFFAYDDYSDCTNEDAVEGFMAGANYVVGLVKGILYNTNDDHQGLIEIKNLIEQLEHDNN